MKRRVLVIDDHSPSRKDLVQALASRGFEVVGEASSGSAAVWLAKTSAPDVILMAVGLADMDGISAARMMMEEHPLPIVLLTSHYERETIERAKGSGVMAYLIKPLREQELDPTIELAILRFDEFVSLRKQNEDLRKALEARKTIERAKGILMKKEGLSESEAFQMLQRKSMETRKPMSDIAEAIVLAGEIRRPPGR